MPSMLYALSYKQTAGVLAFCSLEDRKLTGEEDANKLRQVLVGDAFEISMTPGASPLKIGFRDLAIDPVEDAEIFLDQPYLYRVVGTPGDGKTKPVERVGSNTIVSISLPDGKNTATFTLKNKVLTAKAWLLIEDAGPIPSSPSVLGDVITFELPFLIKKGNEYRLLFLMPDVCVELRTEIGQ